MLYLFQIEDFKMNNMTYSYFSNFYWFYFCLPLPTNRSKTLK
ncbi:hypothetical protein HMPREF0020_03422 [Acinetobacter baumannii 6013113]|nr:hypothetical protein HMPREF0020_03422 [Acinetobacter baumannii 6013113]